VRVREDERVSTRALAVAIAVAVLAVPAASGSRTAARGDVLVTAARLFDGRSFHQPGAVLVRGGKIVAVGGRIDSRAGRTIALGDATILPGFVDLHVHIGRNPVGAAADLRGGVTTVRDLGAPIDALRPPGWFAGLRVLTAGPLVSVAGGYPSIYWGPSLALNVRDPEDARRAVRSLVRRGAAVIKIALDTTAGGAPMLAVAEVRAIVAEAHAHGRRVTAHALGHEAVARALAGGVDELAHTPCGADGEQIRTLVRRRLPVVSTLHVEQLVNSGCLGVAQSFVRRGGNLLYGTDVGNRGIPFGIDVTELRLLQSAD
jgi:imidazolonepropionase-like amidohydrolase